MRRNAVLLLTVLTLVSCGKKWAGTYSGEIYQNMSIGTETATGIGQTSSNNTGSIDVVVTEGPGNAITVEYQGCKFNATKSQAGGQAMALAPVIDCPFPASPGVTFHIDNASLTLTQDSMGWVWSGISHHGIDSGSFNSSFTGNRKR